jgi:hypothetical protein
LNAFDIGALIMIEINGRISTVLYLLSMPLVISSRSAPPCFAIHIVGENGHFRGIRWAFTPKMTGYPRETVQLPS